MANKERGKLRRLKVCSVAFFCDMYYVFHTKKEPKKSQTSTSLLKFLCLQEKSGRHRGEIKLTVSLGARPSLSVLLYLPTQSKQKLQRNCLLHADWLTNLLRFQGPRPDPM